MSSLHNSCEEYDPEKVEKKSQDFLKTIVGNENFDKLSKDGKIEIEVNNKKNDKIVYELYADGKVINKTKNQSYCIVTNRSDYPTNDIVAIKYAYLKHSNEIAEKVANKTNLGTGIRDRARTTTGYSDFVHEMERRGWNRQTINIEGSGGSPYYGDYVDYLSEQGWNRELITIDELNLNFANISSVPKYNTGRIIDIICPPGRKMSIMGKSQTPRGADFNSAYSLGLYITDENGVEIADDTKIRITKEATSDYIVQLARVYYSDVKMQNNDSTYRFMQGIEISGEGHIMVYVVNSPCNIPSENIRFKIETDIWNNI